MNARHVGERILSIPCSAVAAASTWMGLAPCFDWCFDQERADRTGPVRVVERGGRTSGDGRISGCRSQFGCAVGRDGFGSGAGETAGRAVPTSRPGTARGGHQGRLVAQVLGVTVVGEFKRGKSTLVNAILQTDLCPADADIVTAVPTLIRYGQTPLAVAHFGRSDKEDAPMVDEPVEVDQLVEFVSEAADPDRRRRLQSVEVWLPHRLLRTGVCLVDTPGVGGLESAHGAVTLSA